MYRALLVDDEPSVLQHLRQITHWEEFGFYDVSVSSTGEQALSLASDVHFDLIITDIKMPAMDGLTLLKHIKERRLCGYTIILSAFDDFTFVREALRLGAYDFLLKPISSNDINSTLAAISQRLSTEHIQTDMDERNHRQHTLDRWLSGDLTGYELREHCVAGEINLFSPFYVVLIIKALTADITMNELEDLLSVTLPGCQLYHVREGIYIVCTGAEGVKEIKDKLNAFAAQYHGGIFIAVGSVVSNCDEVHTSYRCARFLADSSLLFAPARFVVMDGDIICKASVAPINVADYFNEKSPDLADRKLHAILSSLLGETQGAVYTGRAMILEVMLNLYRLVQSDYPYDEKLLAIVQRGFLTVDKLATLTELEAFIREIFVASRDFIIHRSSTMSPIIQRVLHRIDEEYSQPLTLSQLASEYSMSAAYLGTIFKNETGNFFFEHLNTVRIRHAREMLITTTLTVGAIAQCCGYSDTPYFINCFKKACGMTPNKYRKTYTVT
jgi:two-component system response regulator YesN